MTIEETIKTRVYNNGVLKKDVEAIMERVKNDDVNKDTMRGRWQDSADDYPSILISALWKNACRHAVAHIDETLPFAWYRGLFEEMLFTEEVPYPAVS